MTDDDCTAFYSGCRLDGKLSQVRKDTFSEKLQFRRSKVGLQQLDGVNVGVLDCLALSVLRGLNTVANSRECPAGKRCLAVDGAVFSIKPAEVVFVITVQLAHMFSVT